MLLMWGDGTDSGTKAAARVCEAGWMPWVKEMQERRHAPWRWSAGVGQQLGHGPG